MRTRITALLLALCTLALTACSGGAAADLTGAKTLEDLRGARLAAQGGTFHETALAQVPQVQSSVYPEFADLLTALKSGAIDGYVAEEPTALSVCAADESLTYIPLVNNDTGFTATAADVGIAVGVADGSPLRAEIDAVLDGVTDAQRRELMQQIVAVSAGQTVERFAVACDAPENPKGVLRVGMECAYEPYNWTDLEGTASGCYPISGEGKQGQYANGYDVQIARYIAAQLGMSLEIYAFDWNSLLPALESGAIDAVIAGMSPTAEREAEIDFTQTYYESNLVVIIRR